MRGGEPRLGELLVAGHEQTWLPPLVARESASSKLVKSLQELDTAGSRLLGPSYVHAQAPASAPGTARGLRSISRFGARANERAAEAECDFGVHESEERLDGAFESGTAHASNAHGARDAASCSKAFENLVEGINAAIAGGDSVAPIRALRRDEVVSETLPARGVRHYKIALPSRPTSVTVSVTRVAGMVPALWGSTGVERPTLRSHEMRSSHDRLVYEHALAAADELDESVGLDRRKSAPPCRELFVTAEAEAGESSFKLQVTFGQIKIVLSRAEIASQMQKIRRGWEARVATLQQEPAVREQFEEHVKTIAEDKRKQKVDNHRGVNFLERNMRQVPEASPRKALARLQKKALLGFAKHDEVSSRRELVEEESERCKVDWLNRSEERRLLRLEEQERLELARRVEEMRRAWLVRLAVNSFAVTFGREFTKRREDHAYTRRIIVSACILQKFFIRCFCKKRRWALYQNVVKMRSALSAYARVVRPAVMCASAPLLQGFLGEFAFNRESPSISSALRRFRAGVVKIQSWWQCVSNARKAHVDLFMNHWQEVQSMICRELSVEMASKERGREGNIGRAGFDRRISAAASRHAENTRHAENSRHPSESSRPSSRRPTATNLQRPSATNLEEDREAFLKRVAVIEGNLDTVPNQIARLALWNYVGEMHRSHRPRVERWEEARKEQQFSKDLKGFGVNEEGADPTSAVVKGRPRAVYVDFDELESIVRDNMKMWRKGGYKEIRHHRRQLISKPFRQWARTALQPPALSTPGSKGRRTFLATEMVEEHWDEDGGGGEAPGAEDEASEAEAEAHEEAA